MKVLMKKTGPHQYEADPVDLPGMISVGRGRTLTEALGNFTIAYQKELGLDIQIDPTAEAAEQNRREYLLGQR